MARIPLNSGAYNAEGAITNSQICENLYPEVNPEETSAPTPVTHYPRAGRRPIVTTALAEGRGRGVFTAKNGDLFAVIADTVYFIDPGFFANPLGNIALANTPVSYSNNTQTLVIVDGSPTGYTVDLVTKVFAPIVDGSGLFVGSRLTDYVDTFLVFAKPDSTEWYISDSGTVTFSILSQANKASYPDNIVAIICNIRNVWLLGDQTSEVWFLSGAADFPFEEWPNTFIPYGVAAPYAVCRTDTYLFWLAKNKDGRCIFVRNEGYAVVAVSTRALEAEWNRYADVSDAVAYSYQQKGHTFVVIVFRSANTSWAYDLSTKQWHKITWLDVDGNKNADRVMSCAFAYGLNIGQDYETGALYALDPNVYQDAGNPIAFVRSFPHVLNDMKELSAAEFTLDFMADNLPDPIVDDPNPPSVSISLSKDGGITYGNPRQTPVVQGKPRNIIRKRGWGVGRDLVWKAEWAFNGRGIIQGGFFDGQPSGS